MKTQQIIELVNSYGLSVEFDNNESASSPDTFLMIYPKDVSDEDLESKTKYLELEDLTIESLLATINEVKGI